MSSASDQLSEYLGREEPVRAVHGATVSDDAAWKPASVGVTDRRLLCLCEEGSVVSIGYDSMCAIRSRSRTRLTYRGNDYRLLVGVGSFAAVSAFLGTVALASTLLVPVLAVLAVGGVVAAEYLRRGDATGRTTVDDAAERLDVALDGDDAITLYRRRVPDSVAGLRLSVLAAGSVGAVAAGGLVAVASNPLAVLLVPVAVAGIAVADYAYRHRTEMDGIEAVRLREREVEIDTDGGRTVRIRSEPSEGIDRELNRVAFGEPVRSPQVVTTRS